MRQLLLALVILLTVPFTRAQTQGWFTYDTLNSGIPSNLVTAVEIDAQNAVWVGTAGGLARLENFFNWTVWDQGNSALRDNWISCVKKDPSGRMWVGTHSGGLAVMQGGSFTVYHTQNSPLTSNHITSVAFEGSVAWITTDGGGLYRFDGGTWQNYTSANTGFGLDVCHDVAVDGAGNKWIGTLQAGLVKLSGGTFTGFDPADSDLPHAFVRSVTVENDTTIWLGMGYTDRDSSLAKFNGSTRFSVYSGNGPEHIRFRNVWDILVTARGKKWICTNDLDHGAIFYNDTTFRDYSSFNSGLPYNRVYEAAMDTANVWFATFVGLTVFNEKNATFSVEEQPLLVAHPYPNPAVERIRLQLSPQIHQARVAVFSTDGKQVWTRRLDELTAGAADIPLDGLRAGFYFATVEAQGRTGYFKFIKQ